MIFAIKLLSPYILSDVLFLSLYYEKKEKAIVLKKK